MDFLNMMIYGEKLVNWLIGIGIFLIALVLLRFLKSLLSRRLYFLAKKTDNDLDDFFARLVDRTRGWFLLVLAFYIGSLFVILPGMVREGIRILLVTVLLLQIAFWSNGLIDYLINHRVKQEVEEDIENLTTINALGLIARVVMWSIIVLLILDNIPTIQVTSLIASLGITGVAVALAVQNILGDLFASLSIALDKPFVIGDFIIVGDFTGTVEHIGLKSTRVRSMSGEQLVFSNSDLLSSRIRNYKRMENRRVVFTLGVTYQTPYEKLTLIPSIIQEIIQCQEGLVFERAHFKSFGDFSLNFETVFTLNTPDYNKYMDNQQAINLALYKRFADEGIEFAYPTQTLFLEGNGVKEFASQY